MDLLLLRNCLIIVVALLHLYFLVLEMFLWTKPRGLKTFRMSKERAEDTKALAANQGLYNGFLFAGLIWAVRASDPLFSHQLSIFFLGCVIVAALYGAYSVSWRILLIQGLPALLALGVALFI